MCLCLVEGSYVEEDCVRLHTSGLVYDTVCSNIYVTICQRDADLGKQPRYLMLINEKWEMNTCDKRPYFAHHIPHMSLFPLFAYLHLIQLNCYPYMYLFAFEKKSSFNMFKDKTNHIN